MTSLDLPWVSVRTDVDLLSAMECLGTFHQFRSLLERAALAEDLRAQVVYTVFAPTDAAFARLSLEARMQLAFAPAELLIDVAEHHLVRGHVLLDGVAGVCSFTSVQGAPLSIDGGRVSGAAIVRADLACTNGVLHAIDGVLCPDYGVANASLGERLRRFITDRG